MDISLNTVIEIVAVLGTGLASIIRMRVDISKIMVRIDDLDQRNNDRHNDNRRDLKKLRRRVEKLEGQNGLRRNPE